MSQRVKAIKNAKIVLENGILWDGILLIENDRILRYGNAREMEEYIPENADVIDAKQAYVGPGFVDIHVHGGGGYLTYENPVEASEFFLHHGTTTLLAAPAYEMTFQEFMDAIETVKAAMGKARTLKGLYMEGPFTNPDYGSHAYMNPWRGPVDLQKGKALVDAAGSLAKVLGQIGTGGGVIQIGAVLEGIQLEDGLFPAATVDNLSTGFGLFDGSAWEYGTAPHIAPTAWFVMAINGFNPYSFNH